MPRVECNKSLQDRLALVVQEVGNPSAAAVRLGLSRTLVWRFHKSGCAISRSRHKLEVALDAWTGQAVKAAKNEIQSETNASLLQLAEISNEEFKTMRKYFQNMVAIMDFYEKTGLHHSPQKRGVFSTGNEK